MRKILNILLPLGAVVLGIVVIVFGVNKLKTKNLYDMPATAVITGIEREWTGTDSDGFDTYEYHVYVEYEIDGEKYKDVEYPGYDGSMKVGDELEILYQSADPTQISEKNITGSAILIFVAGAVFIVIGLVMSLRALIRP